MGLGWCRTLSSWTDYSNPRAERMTIVPWIPIIRASRPSPRMCTLWSHWMSSWSWIYCCRVRCPMKSLTWVIQTWVIFFWQFTFAKFFNKFLKICQEFGSSNPFISYGFNNRHKMTGWLNLLKHDNVDQILITYQHCKNYLHIASYV